ncbi:Peptidoglycan glycosyltransferase FtsW [Mucisphaera calidilacus]|uniref:Probable peptidoglycan glycosyltransferase FtsW n=2 Tax=Mucisphaera calidilacus TaxID=2527982 RepID=A0A518BZI3_9BACT|nr:Peptidoglycan glycosyltransferase FtsW [Mucisphaera calidilacus]
MQGAALGLLAIGWVMVHSAGVSLHSVSDEGASIGWLTSRHTLYALIAVAALLLAPMIDVRAIYRHHSWRNPLFWVVIASLALVVLTMVPGWGVRVNGATRWLRLLGVQFQPSELVKWTLLGALAWWGARRASVLSSVSLGLVPPLVLMAVSCGLIAPQDLGSAALIGVVAVAILLAAGARFWQVGLLAIVGVAGVVAMAVTTPYRFRRLTAFLDPWADPAGAGYHPIEAMTAFAHGGVWGTGLGNSVRKYYLPEDTTDFLFPILTEELGLLGAATVIVLLLIVLWAGYAVLRSCNDLFGRLFALGVLLTFGLQALMNLAVVTCLMPTKGIALPLLSAGGTGWIVTAFALGLVAGLDRGGRVVGVASEPELVVEPDPKPVARRRLPMRARRTRRDRAAIGGLVASVIEARSSERPS